MNKNEEFIHKIHSSRYTRLPTHYPSLTLWDKITPNTNSLIFNSLESINNTNKTAIYINIPFCQQKCKFCFLDVLTDKNNFKKYTELLTEEFKLYSEKIKNIPVDTVYIGGGTPNILSEMDLENLLHELHKNFNLSKVKQISMESNIDFWNPEKIKIIKHYGVNFVSIGIQTFDTEILKSQNRIQHINQIYKLFETFKYNNIKLGVDMLIGIYTDTKIFYKDIKKLNFLKPDQIHINRYKPVNNIMPQKTKEKLINIQNKAFSILEENGYTRIDEDSCVLKPYSEFKRNIQGNPKYHVFSNIIGLGIGSMGHIYAKLRYRNTLNFQTYENMINRNLIPVEKFIPLNEKDEIIHYVLVNIGQKNGVSIKEMLSMFSKESFTYILKKLKKLEKQNKVIFKKDKILPNSDIDWYTITVELYDEKHIR